MSSPVAAMQSKSGLLLAARGSSSLLSKSDYPSLDLLFRRHGRVLRAFIMLIMDMINAFGGPLLQHSPAKRLIYSRFVAITLDLHDLDQSVFDELAVIAAEASVLQMIDESEMNKHVTEESPLRALGLS